MTGLWRFAALLAMLPTAVVLPVGTLHGNAGDFAFARARSAEALAMAPPAATRLGTIPPRHIPGGAVRLALPALAWPSLPAVNIGVPVAWLKPLLFWPVAVFAGVAAWLLRFRHARWSRMAVDASEPGYSLPESEPTPVDVFALRLSPEIAPAARAQVQGVDLAARARFVAMTFAFPDTGPLRPGPSGWPLHLNCQPTRFTLTLQHAALNYRLEFYNRGAQALGPLIIRADLVAAHGRIAQDRHVDLASDAMPLCHYLDSMPPASSIEVTGELRLPLAGVAAMRLGTAELLVPLLRLCAESTGDSRPALRVSAGFAIGLPPLSAGGGIQPFRLDAGPGTWRKLTARRLTDANSS